MAAISDIIRSAMRKIGVLGAGEAIPSSDQDDAFEVLRQMVDSWTAESLMIPITSHISKQFVDGVSEYTIGIYPTTPIPDSHFETPRPERIISAFIRDDSGTDYMMSQTSVNQVNYVSRKGDVVRPYEFFVRQGWPLDTIVYPTKPYSTDTMHFEVIQPLSGLLPVASLTEVVNMPPGYERCLIYNLALDLAPEWGREVSPVVALHAAESKRALKSNNYRPLISRVDQAITYPNRASGTYVIESGP